MGEFTTYCPDESCDGLVLGGLCNQCRHKWIEEEVVEKPKSDRVYKRISGLQIEIKEVNLSGGHLGQASLEKSEILINKDLAEDLKEDTLLHEVIHVISDANSLGITEEQTSTLANNLMQYLRDN